MTCDFFGVRFLIPTPIIVSLVANTIHPSHFNVLHLRLPEILQGPREACRVSSITTGNKVNHCLNSRRISLTANHAKTRTSGATRPIDRTLDESPLLEEWENADTEETGSPQLIQDDLSPSVSTQRPRPRPLRDPL